MRHLASFLCCLLVVLLMALAVQLTPWLPVPNLLAQHGQQAAGSADSAVGQRIRAGIY